ncbi:hypothetical protein [Streptomyces sp. NPDC059916]|uniref:hypothetical protein n=1 Tax=Streptomyces sp. NPDC059916 TaxID=3347001 RepID=UPI0036BD1298
MRGDLDKERRYLVPVSRLDRAGQPDVVVHLAVYEWLSMYQEWVTGPALCGYSAQQGPLEAGTVATCQACLEWKPRYERMLAPGYRPEDDDPEVLRRRLGEAENERDRLRAESEDQRKAKQTAAGAADRFRDALCEVLGYPDDNPGDDVLVAKLREHFGKTGPEATAWRDRMAGYEAVRDQISAAAREKGAGE